MKKKAQIQGVIVVVALLLGMIIMAPIILKIGTTVLGTFSTKLSTIDTTNKSSDVATFVKGNITGSFDWVIMILFMVNVLFLLITSFLIDVNPAFVVLYIIFAFALILTLPYTAAVGERIYGMSQFNSGDNNVIQYIPMTEFMLNHFGIVVVAVLVLSGIIMYAKIRISSQQQSSGGAY